MIAIGFRVEPKQIHYVVVRGDGPERNERKGVLAAGQLPAPVTFSEAQSLDWYRTKVLTLIDEHDPDKIAVRYSEPSAGPGKPGSAHRRARIEGIVLEASFSRGKDVITGPWATWSALLGTKSAKSYLGRDTVRDVDASSLSTYQQEALLAALGAIEN